MTFVCSYEKGHAGASLLEVLIALSLLATSILGAAAAQLSALRHAQEQVHREHASWIAASIAEAMQLPESSSNALTHQRARAQTLLPDARVSVDDEAAGMGAVVVQWAKGKRASRSSWTRGFDACSVAQGIELHAHCVALPFAGHGQ